MIKYMVCAFVFASIISTGFGIKCWKCRSDYDPKCGHPFDNATLPITDCAIETGVPGLQNTMCRRIRHKVNGEWRNYIRDCAPADETTGIPRGGQTCFTKTEANIEAEHCICNDKDGCNSSFTFKPSSLLLAFLVLPTLVVKMLL